MSCFVLTKGKETKTNKVKFGNFVFTYHIFSQHMGNTSLFYFLKPLRSL